MTANCILQEIREALEGRPGQPLVLGVCQTLAERWGHEAWRIRLAVLIGCLIWTLPTLAAYVIAGFALSKTERRTRDFFSGLAVLARETTRKVTDALGRLFGDDGPEDYHSRGY
ncbi:PspC domain-containing protein [Elongatibacter sediminis]|uniref:PspC domain-containing protein n=1 Tax=Elongatibacter sediminis TaxID=3119006 RepID=A0AAW9RFZ8_9GAMM